MGHKNHDHCSHALEEDAPNEKEHGSISEWAVMATERQTPWSGSGGVPAKRREQNST